MTEFKTGWTCGSDPKMIRVQVEKHVGKQENLEDIGDRWTALTTYVHARYRCLSSAQNLFEVSELQ
jgi:hypothetical protein